MFARFRRCLKSSTRDSWDSIVEGEAKTNDNFKTLNQSLHDEMIGLDAEENQKEYLKNTPKPNNMSVKNWIRRIKHINGLIRLIEEDAKSLPNKTLIKEVITENVPAARRGDLKA